MDFTEVQKAGSRLGTGTMIVLDDQTCPVGMVWNLEHFFAQESCGWCTPCWSGLPWVERILKAMEEGHGQPGDLDKLAFQTQVLGARPHLLRAGAGRRRAAAERAEVFPRRFRAAHHARSAVRGDRHGDRSTSTIEPYEMNPKQNLLHACLSLGIRTCPISAGIPRWARWAPAASAPSSSSRTRTDTHGQDRDGLHDARRRRHAHLDPGSRGGRVPRRPSSKG